MTFNNLLPIHILKKIFIKTHIWRIQNVSNMGNKPTTLSNDLPWNWTQYWSLTRSCWWCCCMPSPKKKQVCTKFQELMCKVGLCIHPCVHIPHKGKHIIRIPPQQRKKNITTNVNAIHFGFYAHILFYFRMYNFLGDHSSTSKKNFTECGNVFLQIPVTMQQ
jgi:hypothetical protein